MWYHFDYVGTPIRLQRFLQQQGFSRIQLKRLKYQGGFVFVNKRQRNTAFLLHTGDHILVKTAPEKVAASLVPDATPIEIRYEDEDYLVVDKPAGIASIPAVGKPNDSMANRVKAHLITTQAASQAVHVVTRLDRDTSGLMLLAKHSHAHSLIDRQLHTDLMQKHYLAVVSRPQLWHHGWIMLPISASPDFYMRRIATSEGKNSVTEFETISQNDTGGLVDVTLHTGRTHQIRVHFQSIGHPLFGDQLYGGPLTAITRQALHCAQLRFYQPLSHRWIEVHSALPSDMLRLVDRLGLQRPRIK